MSTLGERLRRLRRAKQMSIYDVEDKTGIHFSTISKYERNRRQPSLDRLSELAAAYQVPVGYIVSDEQSVIEYLPEELRNHARLLLKREELSDLLSAAEQLSEREVRLLSRFLEALLSDLNR